jgi:hypothetical protein
MKESPLDKTTRELLTGYLNKARSKLDVAENALREAKAFVAEVERRLEPLLSN